MKTKINTRDYRVPPGDKVDLAKWPTRVKPIYTSGKNYHKLLAAHVKELIPICLQVET